VLLFKTSLRASDRELFEPFEALESPLEFEGGLLESWFVNVPFPEALLAILSRIFLLPSFTKFFDCIRENS
jgi:hypothetical protein